MKLRPLLLLLVAFPSSSRSDGQMCSDKTIGDCPEESPPVCVSWCRDNFSGKERGQCIADAQGGGSGPCYSCNYGLSGIGPGPCAGNRRRMLVEESSWANLKEECSDEDYRLSVFVNNHIQLVAGPNGEGPLNPSCPPILLHESRNEKEVVDLLEDRDKYKNNNNNNNDEQEEEPKGYHKYSAANFFRGFDLGTYRFAAIADAWEPVVTRDAEYDVVRNNCATVVFRTMKNLGIDIDSEITEYVVDRLHQHGKTVEKLRSNPHVNDILPPPPVAGNSNDEGPLGADDYDDAELLELLIMDNIRNFDKELIV